MPNRMPFPDGNPSTNPQLSIRLRSDWLAAILRVDAIERHTLLGLVQHWSDPQARDEVIDALDALAESWQSPRSAAELDGLVDDVADRAVLEDAQIDVSLADALRLRAELDAVIGTLSRFNPSRFPRQQDRRAS